MATSSIVQTAMAGFGLGVERARALPSNGSNVPDYNLAIQSGWYVGYGPATNGPVSGQIFALLVVSGSNLVKTQIAFSYNADGIYVRRWVSSSWTAWRNIGQDDVVVAGYIDVSVSTATAGEFNYEIPDADIPAAPSGYTLIQSPLIRSSSYRALAYGVSGNYLYYAIKSATAGTATIRLTYLARRS